APHLPLRLVRGQRRGDRGPHRGVVRAAPGGREPGRPLARRRGVEPSVKYGLLVPHFGEEADRGKLVECARRGEALGFDALWVRDHLLYVPHGEMERPDRTFYEALTTLTVLGAVTTRIGLGTAALIPFRHPLVLAQTVTTMTHLLGPRLTLGLGVGAYDHEFEARSEERRVGKEGRDRGGQQDWSVTGVQTCALPI